MNKKFLKPKIKINKVYTKTGDQGYTSLIGGKKVKKNSSRICCFGKIDELNVTIGSCVVCINLLDIINKNDFILSLVKIQNDLFNLGNMIATPIDNINDMMPKITIKSVKYLEENIDKYNNDLSSLSSFVLPGGSELNIRFHFARTLCRECERIIVDINEKENIDLVTIKYLNRLSDLLFVWSRYVNAKFSIKELTWDPNSGNN